MSVVQIGQGRRITVQDVLKVMGESGTVLIDESEILQADVAFACLSSTSAASIEPSQSASLSEGNGISMKISKASVFVQLSFLAGLQKPVSSKTLNVLLSCLNSGLVPMINSNSDLASFLCGSGGMIDQTSLTIVDSKQGLVSLGFPDYSLQTAEVPSVSSACILQLGEAAVAFAGLVNSLKAVDGVSALSCEAAMLKLIDAFDTTMLETSRPHRGVLTAAGNLKLLLEGSKLIGQGDDSSVLSATPHSTGPCLDTVTAYAKMLDIELNSVDTSVQDSSICDMVLGGVINATNTLRSASIARCLALSPSFQPFGAKLETSDLSAGRAYRAVVALSGQLAIELSLSLQILAAKEESLRVTATGKTEKEEEDGEDGGKGANPRGGKPSAEEDDSKLTPAQLAKVEAKRRAKAEKAAAKAATKEAKKALAQQLPLGAGTALLRTMALDYIKSNGNSAESLQAILDPFSLNESTSFALFTAKTIEQLSAQGGRRKPKIAKGTRDFGPDQMRVREQAFSVIRQVFKRHGGVEIDTPVFELKEVLTGKYGEDSKLIYDLADQGGELLSLRYDLTVPFARFLAMHSNLGNIKRYHIAKVYRRDNPVLSKGRYREFYQCDFDIAGTYTRMTADAEVLAVLCEILSTLPIGDFMIKMNHRRILDAVFAISGVPKEKFHPICSAVDKLDKATWEEVRNEMVNEKGLDPVVADRIGTFVLRRGKPFELLAELREAALFGDHEGAKEALQDMELLFTYVEAMGVLQYLSFDLSLARGLDYYTGVIFEAVLVDSQQTGVSVGSIAAGGRYDNLVGMFSPGGVQTPCVGGSIGVERVFTIMERRAEQLQLLQKAPVQVFIASIGANMLAERMKLAHLLWAANIPCEYSTHENPQFKRQLESTLDRGIPFMLIIGDDELARGVIKVKEPSAQNEDRQQYEVSREDVVKALLEKGCKTVAGGVDTDFLDALKN